MLIDPQLTWPTPGVAVRHYKGGQYTIVAVARMSEKRDELVVVYRSIAREEIWVRPLGMFTEHVEWADGKRRPRFVAEASLSTFEIEELTPLFFEAREAEFKAELRRMMKRQRGG